MQGLLTTSLLAHDLCFCHVINMSHSFFHFHALNFFASLTSLCMAQVTSLLVLFLYLSYTALAFNSSQISIFYNSRYHSRSSLPHHHSTTKFLFCQYASTPLTFFMILLLILFHSKFSVSTNLSCLVFQYFLLICLLNLHILILSAFTFCS